MVSQVASNSPFNVISYFTGGYYKQQSPEAVSGFPQSPRFNLRETGLRFLQRLSGLRHSVKRARLSGRGQEPARLPPPPPGQLDTDSDRVFFRGFSGADKLRDLRPGPTAPPRRKKLTRSLSLTYGDIVIKKVNLNSIHIYRLMID